MTSVFKKPPLKYLPRYSNNHKTSAAPRPLTNTDTTLLKSSSIITFKGQSILNLHGIVPLNILTEPYDFIL